MGLCPIVTNDVFEFLCEAENIDPSRATEVMKVVESSRAERAERAETAKRNTVTKSKSSEKQVTSEIHPDALRNLEFPPDTTIQ